MAHSSEQGQPRNSLESRLAEQLTEAELEVALRYVEPVRKIPSDPIEVVPTEELGLCLSGGGYRAMLFHTGALWRLNELRYLPELDRVSSVSGGSIVAGVLATYWKELAFDDGIAEAFEEQVVERVMSLAGSTIDWPVALGGALPGGGANRYLRKAYDRALFSGARLADLPPRPMFVFNSTSLQSGKLWRFMKEYMADYKVGRIPPGDTRVSAAVAASSAFPPILSPGRLRLRHGDYLPPTPDIPEPLHKQPYTTRPRLTDGGVYDNFGLETVWKKCRVVLLSDGGGQLSAMERPRAFWPNQAYRVTMIILDQVRALRKRQTIAGYAFKLRGGAYWGIGSHVADFPVDEKFDCPPKHAEALAGISTRLAKLEPLTQKRLVNWGYAIADTAMRSHVCPGEPLPEKLPFPSAGFGDPEGAPDGSTG